MAKQKSNCCGKTETKVTTETTQYGVNCCPIDGKAGITYQGMRLIPVFADTIGMPLEWNKRLAYEQLVYVQHDGDTYISKIPVPPNTEITNEKYWYKWAGYSAQFAELQALVNSFDGRITENADNISGLDEKTDATNEVVSDHTEELESVDSRLDVLEAREKIVIIGDSWSDDTGEWPEKLANNVDYDIVNVAVAGTGFVQGNKNFTVQSSTDIDALIPTNERHLVKHVIVMGGVNDYRWGYTYDDMRSNIDSTFNNLHSRFPKALTYFLTSCGVFTMMDSIAAGSNKRDSYAEWPTWATLLMNRVRAKEWPICVIPDFWWVFNSFGYDMDNVFNNDLLHLSNTGHNILANFMGCLIHGSKTNVFDKTKTLQNKQITLNINGNDVVATWGVSITFSDTLATLKGRLDLPEQVTMDSNLTVTIEDAILATGTFGAQQRNWGLNCHDFNTTIPIAAYWSMCGAPSSLTYSNPIGKGRLVFYLKKDSKYKNIYFEQTLDVFSQFE